MVAFFEETFITIVHNFTQGILFHTKCVILNTECILLHSLNIAHSLQTVAHLTKPTALTLFTSHN